MSAFVWSFSTTATAKQYTFETKKVFAVGDRAELEINYFSGDIRIRSHEVDRIVIKITKTIDAVGMDEARHVADNMLVKTDQSRSSLIVNTSFLKKIKRGSSLWEKLLGTGDSDPYGTVDFEILVPSNCDIKVSNNTGNVKIDDLSGSVTVQSTASDIYLGSIEGDVTVDNAAGITRGELLFGTVTVDQPMGSIDLLWIEGDIRIKSSSATVNVRQERGSLDLTSTTGSVTIQTNVYTGRDCFVSTGSGDIKLLVPSSMSGNLEIMSDLGNIETRMPIRIKSVSKDKLVGELGDGGVKISLTSTTGDVTVAEF